MVGHYSSEPWKPRKRSPASRRTIRAAHSPLSGISYVAVVPWALVVVGEFGRMSIELHRKNRVGEANEHGEVMSAITDI